MAKKKTAETANIKAAPVLRDGNSNNSVVTKSYCVRDDWKDENKVNYVAFKSVDGEVQNLTVNGQPAGGIPSVSVKLNVTGQASDSQTIYFSLATPNGVDALILDDGAYKVEYNVNISGGSSETVNVSMLGSRFMLSAEDESEPVTVTGAATVINEDTSYYVLVTGDCEITFNTMA